MFRPPISPMLPSTTVLCVIQNLQPVRFLCHICLQSSEQQTFCGGCFQNSAQLALVIHCMAMDTSAEYLLLMPNGLITELTDDGQKTFRKDRCRLRMRCINQSTEFLNFAVCFQSRTTAGWVNCDFESDQVVHRARNTTCPNPNVDPKSKCKSKSSSIGCVAFSLIELPYFCSREKGRMLSGNLTNFFRT